jgi:hypothetical protein
MLLRVVLFGVLCTSLVLSQMVVTGKEDLWDRLGVIGDSPGIGKSFLVCSCSILSTAERAWVSNPNDELKKLY